MRGNRYIPIVYNGKECFSPDVQLRYFHSLTQFPLLMTPTGMENFKKPP
jgi:hypothetical protein